MTVTVGISDLNVVSAPDVLVTYALGSCVGICLYDIQKRVAGLSHIMLPSSRDMSASSGQEYKFADTAIPILLQKMERMGANRSRIRAKIAGGAQMFAGVNLSILSSIGERNVIAVKRELQQLHIPLLAEDTGKTYGRTLFLSAADGSMRIKSINQGEWIF